MDSEHRDLLEAALKAVAEVQSRTAGNAENAGDDGAKDFELKLTKETSDRVLDEVAAQPSKPEEKEAPVSSSPVKAAVLPAAAQRPLLRLGNPADDVKMMRINMLKEDLKKCRQDLEQSRSEAEKLRSELEQCRQEAGQVEGAQSQNSQELEQCKSELQAARDELAATQELLKKAQTENAQMRMLYDQIQRSSDQLRAAQKAASEKNARLSADFDNFRKRVARDQEQMKNQAEEKIVLGFLGVMDNFERAIAHAQQSSDFGQLMQGVELTSKLYLGALAKLGCVPYDSMGAVCDPVYHDVLQRVVDPNVPHNTVVQEHLKGYMMHDRVIRPALVVVAQHEDGGVEQTVASSDDAPQADDAPQVQEPQPVEEVPQEAAEQPVEAQPAMDAVQQEQPAVEMPVFEMPDSSVFETAVQEVESGSEQVTE